MSPGKTGESVLPEDRFFYGTECVLPFSSSGTLYSGECVMPSFNFWEYVLPPIDFRGCGDQRTYFMGQVLSEEYVFRKDTNF